MLRAEIACHDARALRLWWTTLAICLAPFEARADLLNHMLTVGDPDPASGPATANPQTLEDLASWAGATKATTLGELLQVTVRQVPALASARYDIAIAEAQIEQTWARRDWTLKAQVSGQRAYGGNIEGIPIDVTTGFLANADLSRLLPTNGTIDFHVGTQYSDTSAPSVMLDSKEWVDNVSVGLNQPLLRNRGRDIYDATEKKLTLARDAAALAKRNVAIQAIQAVVSAYWDLVLAEKSVAITQASLDLAKERLRVTELGASGGKIARAEIPAVEQTIATREGDLLNGELAVVNASIALRRASGMPIGAGELGLRVDTDLDTRDQTWDLGKLTQRAYGFSPELAQLDKQRASSTIDIEVTENGLLPQLDLALQLGPAGQEASFGKAAKDLVTFSQLSIAGSLTYTQSLNHYDVRGRARELRLQRDKLQVNAFDIKAQIAATMARGVAQVELAKRRVGLAQRAIDLANQNIQIETDRFNLGKSTNFDVLLRLEELRQAELSKVQAMIDWHKGATVVMALTGDLLATYGISIE